MFGVPESEPKDEPMTNLIAILNTLTKPQTLAIIHAIQGYFYGNLAFKVTFGMTRDQVEELIAGFDQLPGRGWTDLDVDLVKLLPRMCYTVPEGREQGVYLRALTKLGLINAPTIAALEAPEHRHSTRETESRVLDILNPKPRDPRPYQVVDNGDRGRVSVHLFDTVSTSRVFWSARCNSYVLIPDPARGEFQTPDGRNVSLVSVNGAGEIRWTVTRSQVDFQIKNGFKGGDGEESLAAALHFGLVTLPQPLTIDQIVDPQPNPDQVKIVAHLTDLTPGQQIQIGTFVVELSTHEGFSTTHGQFPTAVALADWLLDTAPKSPILGQAFRDFIDHGPGDAECTSCHRMFWSGQGHPSLAICGACHRPGKPRAATPVGQPDHHAERAAVAWESEHGPDALDFSSSPLPEGHRPRLCSEPPPSSDHH